LGVGEAATLRAGGSGGSPTAMRNGTAASCGAPGKRAGEAVAGSEEIRR